MLNRGELDGIRLLGRETVELMTVNHLPDGQDLTMLAERLKWRRREAALSLTRFGVRGQLEE